MCNIAIKQIQVIFNVIESKTSMDKKYIKCWAIFITFINH